MQESLDFNFDLVIIGAGPAGMSAAQYGARAGLKVMVLEQSSPGGQALLIDKLENYPGISGEKSGYEFCSDLQNQAEKFGAGFLNAQAQKLEKSENLFKIKLDNGEALSSRAVILAMGAKHKKLGIPGEDELAGCGVSYCAVCDGPFFKKKKIFVAGGGDAACDEANYLSKLSPHIIMIHRRDRFRAQKALQERVFKNPGIEVRFNTIIKEICGETFVNSANKGQRVVSVVLEETVNGKGTGLSKKEDADAVFIFAGTVPQTSLVTGNGTINVKTDASSCIITDQKMASSVPGIFAAGDLRSGSFRQVVVAAGEGASAAHFAAKYINEISGGAY